MTYADAFGYNYKVDRIADFLKAQKAEAEISQREGERFQARHKAAENCEKRLKQMLVWFILTRNVQKLRGELNTILPAGEQRSLAGCQRDDAYPRQLLSSADRDHLAGVD